MVTISYLKGKGFKMFLLNVRSKYDYEINDIIGVFDDYFKAQEKQQELKSKFDDEFDVYVIKYDLNVVYDHDIEQYLQER